MSGSDIAFMVVCLALIGSMSRVIRSRHRLRAELAAIQARSHSPENRERGQDTVNRLLEETGRLRETVSRLEERLERLESKAEAKE